MPEFVTVAETSEIHAGQMKEVDVNGQSVLLANVGGHYYAIEATCTHRGGPLPEGELHGDVVTCPWHFGGFDVRTGEAVALPPTDSVNTYRVRVTGSAVQVAPN
ncbi:MAG TPA: non-heme iron oxygenase ferredoxin subunit [Chloroflexota bacterium]|nr:non-heme iron oxygenase ferredoxin subunit [Chloroflexota bacterium]